MSTQNETEGSFTPRPLTVKDVRRFCKEPHAVNPTETHLLAKTVYDLWEALSAYTNPQMWKYEEEGGYAGIAKECLPEDWA